MGLDVTVPGNFSLGTPLPAGIPQLTGASVFHQEFLLSTSGETGGGGILMFLFAILLMLKAVQVFVLTLKRLKIP